MNTLNTPSYTDDRYSIFKLYNDDALSYYLCIPNSNIEACNIYIGLPKVELDTINDELEIIESEIKPIYNKIYEMDRFAVYILPDISTYDLLEATSENDNKLYNIINHKINSIGSDACETINKNRNIKIYRIIKYIKQNDYDRKFIGWLEIKEGNLIEGIDLNNNVSDTPQLIEPIATNEPQKTNNNVKKRTHKPSKNGFSSFTFTIMILAITLVIGIVIFTIIKK